MLSYCKLPRTILSFSQSSLTGISTCSALWMAAFGIFGAKYIPLGFDQYMLNAVWLSLVNALLRVATGLLTLPSEYWRRMCGKICCDGEDG